MREPRLLLPAEVAALFDVSTRTVARWSALGLLPAVRTIGGHRRYDAAVVRALIADGARPLRDDAG